MSAGVTPGDVLSYWFGDTVSATAAEFGPKMRRWYQGGPEVDAEIIQRFSATVEDALDGKLGSWSDHPKGWLAELLVLDQFTRNVLRNSPRMYLGDERAQAIAVEAFDSKKAYTLNVEERNFALMPLVHAENLALQERGVAEMKLLVADAPEALRGILGMGIEQTAKYRDVIARFGRFPHRNEILGRTPTPDETAFLRDWEAKRKPAGADDLPPVKKG